MRIRRPADHIPPCLPSRAERPPSGPDWLHEIKHDGFRILARRDNVGEKAEVTIFQQRSLQLSVFKLLESPDVEKSGRRWLRDQWRSRLFGNSGAQIMALQGINDAKHWRDRAAEMRVLSDVMKDQEAQRMMLKPANDYDRLDDRAEYRAARDGPPGPSPIPKAK